MAEARAQNRTIALQQLATHPRGRGRPNSDGSIFAAGDDPLSRRREYRIANGAAMPQQRTNGLTSVNIPQPRRVIAAGC